MWIPKSCLLTLYSDVMWLWEREIRLSGVLSWSSLIWWHRDDRHSFKLTMLHNFFGCSLRVYYWELLCGSSQIGDVCGDLDYKEQIMWGRNGAKENKQRSLDFPETAWNSLKLQASRSKKKRSPTQLFSAGRFFPTPEPANFWSACPCFRHAEVSFWWLRIRRRLNARWTNLPSYL